MLDKRTLIRQLKFGLANELGGLNEDGGEAVLEYVQNLLWAWIMKVDEILEQEYGFEVDEGWEGDEV